MQIDLDGIRRHYDGLTDEALLDINPDELTDAARACLDEEIALRELQPHFRKAKPSELVSESEFPQPGEPGSEREPSQHADAVGIGVYSDVTEATLARTLLHLAEIPAYLANEKMRGVNWNPSNFAGGLELMVPASLAEQAREVLASQISEEELAAQAEAAAPEEEPT